MSVDESNRRLPVLFATLDKLYQLVTPCCTDLKTNAELSGAIGSYQAIAIDDSESEHEMGVHTYGIAPEGRVDVPLVVETNDEESALLGYDATPKVDRLEGRATMLSCISNLANTIIGSGMCFALLRYDTPA